MELRPIERIRGVGAIGVRRSASDVAPALGADAAGRMEEDSYSGSAKRQDRGLEDEEAGSDEEQELSDGVTGTGKVDVLA